MADQPSLLSDVRVFQALTPKGNFYPTSSDVHVSFNLAQAADVTVEVGAHMGAGGQISGSRDSYMADPIHVQTLKLGHLEAGAHEAIWNGLDEKGQPVTETQFNGWVTGIHAIWIYLKGALPTIDQIWVHPTVDLFRFTVQAGNSQVGVNYRRARAGVGAYHVIAIGDARQVSQDENGNLVASNNSDQYCSHLSPGGEEIGHYPDSIGFFSQGLSCPESQNGLADFHGHALISDVQGLFRFDLGSGQRLNWAKSNYSQDGAILGRKAGPGDTEATVKTSPGVAYGFYNWTVDPAGNIYLLRSIADLARHPNWNDGSVVLADVQVFDNNGVYKKTIALPKEAYWGTPGLSNTPQQLAVDKDGNVWVGSQVAYLIDGQTGAIKARFKNPTQGVFVGADGSVYGWGQDGVDLYRLHADGTPFPFGAKALGMKNNGESLSWGGDDSPLPPTMRSVAPYSVIGEAEGDFYVVMRPGADNQPMLHFSADGAFLPAKVPRLDLVPSRAGNAFIENEPAAFDVCVNNTNPTDLPLTLDWTLTDFYGKKTTGKTDFQVKALSRQACVVTVPVPEFGFYHLDGSVENDVTTFKTALARVRFHDPKPAPDSHFAIVGNLNFPLGAVIGQKKDRGSSYEWEWREPAPGLLIPDVPLVGYTAHRNIAARAGILLGEDSNYAEPWTEGYPTNQIHDLSLYLNDWMGVVDKINGNDIQQYQFWNEPNNYWSRTYPSWNEYFDTVNGDFWRINKARDKETRSIPDGNAGNFDIMTVMGADGTNIYCDGVPCHYLTPGVDQQPKLPASLGPSEMGSSGFPEYNAINVKKLAAVRDQFYPGRGPSSTPRMAGIPATASTKKPAPIRFPACISPASRPVWTSSIGLLGEAWTLPGGYTVPVTSEHPPENIPQAAFCSYATMTQELEGAEYVGTVDLQKEGTQAYLFRKGDKMILPVWAMVGQIDVSVPVGAGQVRVFDLMSHQSQVSAVAGSIPLHLTDSVQYVEFPFNDWAKSIAKQELDRQLTDLKLSDVKSIPDEMKTAATAALTDLGAMNRYFHLVKAARQACFAEEWPETAPDSDQVKSLRRGILAREGDDGYLRQTRLPLLWTEQLVRVAAIQGGDLAKHLLSVADGTAALASQSLLPSETVIDPGCALNAFIGDVGEIEKIRGVHFKWGDSAWPFYEARFRSQIPKKAGDAFELELNLWNFYRHPIQATMAPKLPDGWTAVPAKPQDGSLLAPGKFARVLYTVTIPAGTKAGIYPIDGTTTYDGKTQSSVLPQRIQIQ